MKRRVIGSVRLLASDVASRVESWTLGGRVRVLVIECRDCQRRVKPADWNPRFGRCEVCAGYELSRMRLAARLRSVSS